MFSNPKYLNRGKDSTVQELKYSNEKTPTKVSIVCKAMASKNFNKEVLALLDCRHPHLENIFYIWLRPGQTLLFCEKLDKTLNNIEIKNPLQELNIVEQVLCGLKYLHTKYELAHCDLKENNIMIDHQEKHVKIIDFNNCMPAKSFGTFELGIVLAKKHKDLLKNPSDWDWRVDFWALGCTIFQVKYKRDIIDDFLNMHKIDYNTLDQNYQKLKTKYLLLYNFYLKKLKEFEVTEQIIYACLMSYNAVNLENYLSRYRNFHNLDPQLQIDAAFHQD